MTEEITPYTPIYAIKEDILARIGFLQQAPKEELLESVMRSADDTVNSRLARYNHHTFQDIGDIPNVLQTAANYYAISDLLQSIYGKDDRSSNEEGFYQKAENLMMDYIQQMLLEEENQSSSSDDSNSSLYGISQSPDAFDLGLLHR